MIKKKKFRVLGIIFLVLWCISYFGFVIVIFTWPLFILGSILIWKSDLNKKSKFSWTFFPILPIILFSIASIPQAIIGSVEKSIENKKQRIWEEKQNSKRVENRIFINKDFSYSRITLLYNSKCAVNDCDSLEQLGHKIVNYEVPKDGIVIMRDSVNKYDDFSFYLKDSSGNLYHLEHADNNYNNNQDHDLFSNHPPLPNHSLTLNYADSMKVIGKKDRYVFHAYMYGTAIIYLEFEMIDNRVFKEKNIQEGYSQKKNRIENKMKNCE